MRTSILIVSILLLFAIDAVYLVGTKSITLDQIVLVQKFSPTMRIPAALIVYVFLFLGLYYFILKNHRSPFDAFLLGIVIYGVFEFTNYAIFKNWKLNMVLMDTLWGGALMALTTYFTYKVERIM